MKESYSINFWRGPFFYSAVLSYIFDLQMNFWLSLNSWIAMIYQSVQLKKFSLDILYNFLITGSIGIWIYVLKLRVE